MEEKIRISVELDDELTKPYLEILKKIWLPTSLKESMLNKILITAGLGVLYTDMLRRIGKPTPEQQETLKLLEKFTQMNF